jgi:hypothetical protein
LKYAGVLALHLVSRLRLDAASAAPARNRRCRAPGPAPVSTFDQRMKEALGLLDSDVDERLL